jgi:hypothetical protein
MLLPWLSPGGGETLIHVGDIVYYSLESDEGRQDYVVSGGGARVAYQASEEMSETVYIIPGVKR